MYTGTHELELLPMPPQTHLPCSVAKARFHPTGDYVLTTSFDSTWRMWDARTAQELLLQEGHTREVYGLSCQCDGSLVATGDLTGLIRVWDLRTGRCELNLKVRAVVVAVCVLAI